MQLIALEQLCMLLLMSDNVDRSGQCNGFLARTVLCNARTVLCNVRTVRTAL